MPRRKLLFLSLFLLVVVAVGSVVYYRIATPSRTLYWLPEGDLVLYINFSPAHFFELGPLPAESDPEYQDFVQHTGFQWEHDLDTIAISQRRPGGPDTESSAIFTGHFDKKRLSDYLQRRSSDTEKYGGADIFVLHHDNELVRACVLNDSTVAVTNMQSAEPMHSIIDKAGHTALGAKGPSLVEDYYRYVPFGSLGWAIIRVPRDADKPRLGELDLDFLQNTVSIASVRYTGSLRIKVEIFSQNQTDAQHVQEAATTFVAFGRTMVSAGATKGSDKDVKDAFDSLQVQQNGNRTQITLTIPQAFLQKLSDRMSHPGQN